jgi:hypothetical protein
LACNDEDQEFRRPLDHFQREGNGRDSLEKTMVTEKKWSLPFHACFFLFFLNILALPHVARQKSFSGPVRASSPG